MFAGTLNAAIQRVKQTIASGEPANQPSVTRKTEVGPVQRIMEERIAEVEQARLELINSADLARIHHEVHAAIGEENWETFAKPEFLQEITRRTRASTGSAEPTWQEVVAWVRNHPDEANRLLESYKNDPRFTR